MANVIHTQVLKLYKSISFQNGDVFRRYSQIVNYLKQNLGEEYASFFASPHISNPALQGKSKARWTSEVLSEKAKSLTSLSQHEQDKYYNIYVYKKNVILKYCDKLQKSNNEDDKNWAKLIITALEIPDESYIFTENNDVTLVIWGFRYKNKSKQNYGLSKNLGTDNSTRKNAIETTPPLVEENFEENFEEKIEETHSTREHETVPEYEEFEQETETQDSSIENDINKPPPDNNDEKSEEKPPWFKRNWKWLLLAFIILLLFVLCIIFCRSDKTYLPDKPNVIIPIDTTKIVNDPDSVRSIVSNRLNIALQGDNKDIKKFTKKFKQIYPDKEYKILYYDIRTNRIQIQIPADKRAIVKKELPKKMSEFKMLIWHEGIFKRNYTPSDPGFGDNRKSWYHIKIKAIDAWEISKGDPNVIIAIIDNGFDLTHPEFAGKIVKPWNIPDGSANVNTGLNSTHGTHVAGISIGLADNGEGVSGIAPNCKFMPIQVGDYNGLMSTTSVIDGVLYAINNGANVVNMSLGMQVGPRIASLPQNEQEAYIKHLFKDEEEFWNQLFQMAYDKNIVFVLAAGNQKVMIGLDPMQRSDKTIKVSAIDPAEQRADFSNYGSKSTISAPGVEIYSSMPNNKFAYMNGTSMAAPVVTGGIAIIKSINPALSYDEIVDLIQSTGIPVNSPNNYVGNILQLDIAARIAGNNRKKQPIVDCPDLQDKIDSLLQEIEKIRKQCPDTSKNTGDTLKIPDKPKDYEFAKGRWKSTTYIYNDSGEKITIYFDFYANGKGVITLVEPDNTQCSANLDLSLNSNKFIVDQKQNSVCNPPPKKYQKYLFECQPDNTGCAECWAQNKTDRTNRFKFKLIKIN